VNFPSHVYARLYVLPSDGLCSRVYNVGLHVFISKYYTISSCKTGLLHVCLLGLETAFFMQDGAVACLFTGTRDGFLRNDFYRCYLHLHVDVYKCFREW
jgi:hypothetical protein